MKKSLVTLAISVTAVALVTSVAATLVVHNKK